MSNENKKNLNKSKFLKYTQNFLHSTKLVDDIVCKSGIEEGMSVLEIGPGKGIITHVLAKKVGKEGEVFAVEMDTLLAEKLKEKLKDLNQVRIIENNILDFNLKELPKNYIVFSNIPFNITSDLLEFLLNPYSGPQKAFLILQTDTLKSNLYNGEEAETFKFLLIKPFYDLKVIHEFSPSDFTPVPGIDTALFSFQLRQYSLVERENYELYKDFLSFISKDRVGEGVWTKIFSKPQLNILSKNKGLVTGKGLKSQSLFSIVEAFHFFITLKDKQFIVKDSFKKLREEQNKRESINRLKGHHRSNKYKRKKF